MIQCKKFLIIQLILTEVSIGEFNKFTKLQIILQKLKKEDGVMCMHQDGLKKMAGIGKNLME